MEKTIILNGEDLRLKSSLFTIIEYRSIFGTELFKDITKLEQSEKEGNLSEVLFKIIYVLHRPFTKKSYEEFLQSIDFSLLTNINELENVSNTIAELLGGSKVNEDNPK
ncbi:MAG TPA: hypothetical protein PLE44_01260 [Bacilli bacterium]|nr:hypothetical protein [Bacilli bacterium]